MITQPLKTARYELMRMMASAPKQNKLLHRQLVMNLWFLNKMISMTSFWSGVSNRVHREKTTIEK